MDMGIMSLRPEVTMDACKQLPVLWCRTTRISNPVMEGFWVQASICEAMADQDGIDLSKWFGLNISQCPNLANPRPG